MVTFDKLVDQLLNEFNVEDRNDLKPYDYAVLLARQLKQRSMIKTKLDVRSIAMSIITPKEDGRYFLNYNNTYEIEFVIDDINIPPSAIIVKELSSGKVIKEVTNIHEESSIEEVVEFLSTEEQKQQSAGISAPEQVSEVPSEMPDAVKPQTPNTSKYISGV
jgi:hypothetical protein